MQLRSRKSKMQSETVSRLHQSPVRDSATFEDETTSLDSTFSSSDCCHGDKEAILFEPEKGQTKDTIDVTISYYENAHVVCIFDMVFVVFQALLILMFLLPADQGEVSLAAICSVPCLLRFVASILFYVKTEKIHQQSPYTLMRHSMWWLLTSFVTVIYETVFLGWITMTARATKFILFIVGFKALWAFIPMFFVNEFHNDIAHALAIHAEQEHMKT